MKGEIQKLIDAGKHKEAFEIFKTAFFKESNIVDEGEVYTNLFGAYLDALNNVNTEELTILDFVNKLLAEANSAQKNAGSKADAQKIREEILSNLN